MLARSQRQIHPHAVGRCGLHAVAKHGLLRLERGERRHFQLHSLGQIGRRQRRQGQAALQHILGGKLDGVNLGLLVGRGSNRVGLVLRHAPPCTLPAGLVQPNADTGRKRAQRRVRQQQGRSRVPLLPPSAQINAKQAQVAGRCQSHLKKSKTKGERVNARRTRYATACARCARAQFAAQTRKT